MSSLPDSIENGGKNIPFTSSKMLEESDIFTNSAFILYSERFFHTVFNILWCFGGEGDCRLGEINALTQQFLISFEDGDESGARGGTSLAKKHCVVDKKKVID